jgi:hypothetical protein
VTGPEGADTGFATRFALGALATWRLTHLIAEEDGPADAVVRLRVRLGSSELGRLMDCFACTSVWVAAPVTLAVARRGSLCPAPPVCSSG